MMFRPCIDIHDGKVKQIVGSTLLENRAKLVENFVATKPATYYAKLYKKDGLIRGHIIMLDNTKKTKEAARSALSIYPGGFRIGGGITDANAKSWLDFGALQIVVTSFVFADGKINLKNLEKLIKSVGKEKLVLDLSCRKKEGKYFVVTNKWQKFTSFELNKKNIELLQNKCAEFLVHASDSDGKCNGVQDDVIEIFAKYANIPITYAGGVSLKKDIERVKNLGKGKIDFTIGSALDIFGGKMEYKKVLGMMK